MNNLNILYNAKNYTEIANIWNNSEDYNIYNNWDFLHFINSFYALKQYQKCLVVYKQCLSVLGDCTMLENKMSWSLYHTKIKTFDFEKGDISELFRQIDYILVHCDNSQFSPRWCVINFITKAINNGKIGEERDFSLMESYLLQVTPDTLSKKEIQMNTGRPLPSNYESWYSRMTKSLLEQQKYEECIKYCDKVLATIEKFHSNNNIWFNYRKAKSLRGIGKGEEGTDIINSVLLGKFSHWCLYEYLFDNAVNADDKNSAAIYGAKCALADNEHKMRVTFYQKYAEFLESYENNREAMLLHRLIILIRQEEGWNEKSYFADWNISDDIVQMSKENILKELNEFWKKLNDIGKINGYIKTIICEGSAGFIEDNEGNSYYFSSRSFKGQKEKIVEGQAVKFELIDGFDKKKNKKVKNAVNITL